MLFVVGLIIWWLIGYVGFTWLASRDTDIDAFELFFMFPLLGTGGPITILIFVAVEYGDRIVIPARNRDRW